VVGRGRPSSPRCGLSRVPARVVHCTGGRRLLLPLPLACLCVPHTQLRVRARARAFWARALCRAPRQHRGCPPPLRLLGRVSPRWPARVAFRNFRPVVHRARQRGSGGRTRLCPGWCAAVFDNAAGCQQFFPDADRWVCAAAQRATLRTHRSHPGVTWRMLPRLGGPAPRPLRHVPRTVASRGPFRSDRRHYRRASYVIRGPIVAELRRGPCRHACRCSPRKRRVLAAGYIPALRRGRDDAAVLQRSGMHPAWPLHVRQPGGGPRVLDAFLTAPLHEHAERRRHTSTALTAVGPQGRASVGPLSVRAWRAVWPSAHVIFAEIHAEVRGTQLAPECPLSA